MINFRPTKSGEVAVYVDGKRQGKIVRLKSSGVQKWQYWAQDKKKYAGDEYPTLYDVKKSLVCDEP